MNHRVRLLVFFYCHPADCPVRGSGRDEARSSGERRRKTDARDVPRNGDRPEPQLSPDGSQIIYTRGWIDKMNDRRESALWIMNADGSRNRFLAKGSARGGLRPATVSRISRRASRRARSCSFAGWTRKGPTSQVTRVEQSPTAVAWSPDGTQLSLQRCSSRIATRGRSRCRRRPRAPSGPRRRALSSASSTGATAPASSTRVPSHLRRPGDRRDARQLDVGQSQSHRERVDADGRKILFSGLRTGTTTPVAESDIYSVDVATGDIKALTSRSGAGREPERLAGRQPHRLHRERLGQGHVDRQQDLRHERRRIGSAPRVGRLGSVAVRAAAGSRTAARSTSPRRTRDRRTSTAAARRRTRRRSSRSRAARTCCRSRTCRRTGRGRHVTSVGRTRRRRGVRR